MKILKKTILVIVGMIVISCITGYFYFDKKFTPEPNSLMVVGESGPIPIFWQASNSSQFSALLLPVQIDGIDDTFFMQFDTGSPNTIFYKSSLDTIQKIYKNNLVKMDSVYAQLNFQLGEMNILSDKFKVYNVKKSWNRTDSIKIIGTIGTDLMEKRTTVLNFKENFVSFKTESLQKSDSDFEFRKRRILFPIKIYNKEIKVIFDSGTSAYEYIASKEIWDKIRIPKQKVDSAKGNSMGNILTTYTTKTKEQIKFQKTTLRLNEVTYIEGYSSIQYLMMKLTRMGGMLGNKAFFDKTLILDCKNQKYLME